MFICLGLTPVFSAGSTFDFSLKDLQGKQHALSEYRGKWVLVNFWATWCPPCREEMPALSALHSNNDAIVVVGVNYHEQDAEKVASFVEGLLLDFPVWMLPIPKVIPKLNPIQALPTSVLVSPQGEVVAQFAGVVDVDAVEKYIASH